MDAQKPRIEELKLKKEIIDVDFTPPVEMMIHDYDDEKTLDEEEALGALEDPQVELSGLEREGNMPLEDLMAMYGYNNENCKKSSENMDKKSEPSELEQLYNDTEEPTSVRSTRYGSRAQSEDDEDEDYSPEETRKKTIMVGSDYQAQIPEGLCRYDDALPYENEDKLVWDPRFLGPNDIEDYLVKAQEPSVNGVNGIPMGNHTRDDEQALFELLKCGFNTEEALRRLRLNAAPTNTDDMSIWSEEECRNFESGLRAFGKDFRQIKMNKVSTRSVGELVQFYYLWKKTERHDIFANKARLGKKKYSLHPGVTDYMERFLDGDERPRTESPNVHSLLYGDQKRHQTEEKPEERSENS